MKQLLITLILGIGATAAMDTWSLVRRPLLGIPAPNYGLVGRWIGHMIHGRFRHDSIAAASPVRGERLLGWASHYLIGIAFAGLMLVVSGPDWVDQPTITAPLAVGIVTVLAPFLLMQPGMGAGIAASCTPRPNSARLQSLITHAVFGLGLYITGFAMRWIYSS